MLIRFAYIDTNTSYNFEEILFILICLSSYDRKCPYQEPRLYCSVVPNKVSSVSLFAAEQLGIKLANSLIKKNALDVMSQARNEILDSK